MKALSGFLSAVVDLLFPPRVLLARARKRLGTGSLLLHPRKIPEKPWVSTLSSYEEPAVRDLVLLAKFHNNAFAAEVIGHAVGEYLIEMLSETALFGNDENPLIIPIPLGEKRRRERGYNQAERIARIAARMLPERSVSFSPEILSRRETLAQSTLSKKERLANVHGAFFVPHPETVCGTSVILIDDVVTTGATLSDARRALRAAGARDVRAIVFARAE